MFSLEHAGGDHEELAIHFQFPKIALLQTVTSASWRLRSGRRLFVSHQVIDFREHAPWATDVNRLPV